MKWGWKGAQWGKKRVRKLIKLGPSSLVVSIPHPFVEEYNLEQGDEMLCARRGRKVVFIPMSIPEQEIGEEDG